MAIAEDTVEKLVKASCALQNWIRETSTVGNLLDFTDTDDSNAHSAAGAFRKTSWKSSERESRAAALKRQPPCPAMAMEEGWETTAEIDTRGKWGKLIQIFLDHSEIR